MGLNCSGSPHNARNERWRRELQQVKRKPLVGKRIAVSVAKHVGMSLKLQGRAMRIAEHSGARPVTPVSQKMRPAQALAVTPMEAPRPMLAAGKIVIAPYGYPEIDFAEAKAEGEYIRAFEQSFEWNNMVHLFYPYFWRGDAPLPR